MKLMPICKLIAVSIISISLISPSYAVTIAQITASSLNVRQSPNGEKLFSLSNGTMVAIMSVQGDWAQIMHLPGNDPQKARTGWVSVAYLKVVGGSGSSRTSSYGGVSGDDCELEYDSDAQVCITATGADLDCREAHDGSYYRSCEIEVDYDLSTDYGGDDYLSVDVECEVEIKYKKRDSYSWSYDSESESENHTLYSYGSESSDMDFDFSFSSYKEVVSVKIDSVECEIESVYKY